MRCNDGEGGLVASIPLWLGVEADEGALFKDASEQANPVAYAERDAGERGIGVSDAVVQLAHANVAEIGGLYKRAVQETELLGILGGWILRQEVEESG